MVEEKLRYSDEELEEFKALVEEKLKTANAEYQDLRKQLRNGDNSDRDTAPVFKNMEDGADTLNREELGLRASRLEKFIKGHRVHKNGVNAAYAKGGQILQGKFQQGTCCHHMQVWVVFLEETQSHDGLWTSLYLIEKQ